MNKVKTYNIFDMRRVLDQIDGDGGLKYILKRYLEAAKAGLQLGGVWQARQFRGGELIAGAEPESPNIFTTEGLVYLHNVIFGANSKVADRIWYVGLMGLNVTPVASHTASGQLGAYATGYGELQDTHYDSPLTNRAEYLTDTATTATITNATSPANFTMAQDNLDVYGAFLTDKAGKTDASGVLMSAKKFASARTVQNDDVLAVTVEVTATSS